MFDLQVNTYEPVTGIERLGDGTFTLETSPARGKQRYQVRRIVLATGGTTRPRMLNIPGENLPHVSHFYGDPHDYFRRKLLVVGGKNSAVEAALRCHHAGAKVSLSYRREQLDPKHIKYWLMPEMNGLIQSGAIQGHFRTQPVEITPTHVKLQRDSDTFDVEADFVLLLTGYEADMSLCRLAGVQLHGECQTPVHDPQTMETNVPGIYVAGTVVGGTQDKYTLFIENCHVHTERIVAAITHQAPPAATPTFDRPES
jgi:thioredoxin reductase (NADPH)